MLEDIKKDRLASFKSSSIRLEADDRLKRFALRGITAEDCDSRIVNKLIDASNTIEVINMVAYALNLKPNVAAGERNTLRLTENGESCMVQGKKRELLEQVVRQMPCYKFMMIPLVMGIGRDKKWVLSNSLLIKSPARDGTNRYIDMAGRIYPSFHNFLEDNKMSYSVLCFPDEGVIQLDKNLSVIVDYRVVGMENTLWELGGLLAGTVNLVSLFVPPLRLLSIPANAFLLGRGVVGLVDALDHGQSINPFSDTGALLNWLQVASNICSVSTIGLQFFTSAQLLTSFNIGTFILSTTSVTARLFFTTDCWNQLTDEQELSAASALCFTFREVISLKNARKLMREIQCKAMCVQFGKFVRGTFNRERFMALLKNTADTLRAVLWLAKEFVEANISIKLTDDFVTTTICGHEFNFANILQLTNEDISKLINVVKALGETCQDLFFILRQCFGEKTVLKLIYQRTEQLHGNYKSATQQTIQLLDIVRSVREEGLVAMNVSRLELIIGNGHQFKLSTAFDLFAGKLGLSKSVALFRALLQMSPKEAEQLNQLRCLLDSDGVQLLLDVTCMASCTDGMLRKLRAKLGHEDGILCRFGQFKID